MRTRHLTALAALLLATPSALARVTIEVLDPVAGKFRVTYEVPYTRPGSTESVFPPDGFQSERKLEVESVRERSTDQTLEFEVVDHEGARGPVANTYQVKARFRNPIAEGGMYLIEYRLILYRKTDCRLDKNGRWTIRYTTARDALFVVPRHHRVVYCNHPVLIYEKKESTVLEQKPDPERLIDPETRQLRERVLIFKTLPILPEVTKPD